jgi:hypothetical protein
MEVVSKNSTAEDPFDSESETFTGSRAGCSAFLGRGRSVSSRLVYESSKSLSAPSKIGSPLIARFETTEFMFELVPDGTDAAAEASAMPSGISIDLETGFGFFPAQDY